MDDFFNTSNEGMEISEFMKNAPKGFLDSLPEEFIEFLQGVAGYEERKASGEASEDERIDILSGLIDKARVIGSKADAAEICHTTLGMLVNDGVNRPYKTKEIKPYLHYIEGTMDHPAKGREISISAKSIKKSTGVDIDQLVRDMASVFIHLEVVCRAMHLSQVDSISMESHRDADGTYIIKTGNKTRVIHQSIDTMNMIGTGLAALLTLQLEDQYGEEREED